MRNSENLSVAERLKAAAAFHYNESPGLPLSISALCSAAGVNRANAYERHIDLIRDLIRSDKSKVEKDGFRVSKGYSEQIKRLTEVCRKQSSEYKALLNICIEQMAEIRSLRLRLESISANMSKD